MKIKINIVLMLIVSAFFMFFGKNNLNAATLEEIKHQDIWFYRGGNATFKPGSARFAEYFIDGEVSYCVQPAIQIKTHNYIEIPWVESPYTDEINLKLHLIAYYGFGYPGHEDLRYKMATQFLIWKTTSDMSFKYTTEASGYGDLIDVSKEENEIMELVNTHYNLPSFNNETKDAVIGQTITFTDSVGTLERYEILENPNVTGSINGNTLTLIPNTTGEIMVGIRMKRYSEEPTSLFVGDDGESQMQGRFNIDDPIYFNVKLNVSGASLEIIKKDAETNTNIPQGNASLEGAKYELQDEDGNHITYLVTDITGRAKTENILSLNKKYLLIEREASYGYLVDSKVYEVYTGDTLETIFEVKEEINKKEVEIIKVYASGNTGVLTPEPNITFDIYLKSTGEYYNSVTTNLDGFASIRLPFGVWTWKQRNSSPNYEKVDDFDVIINDNTTKVSKYLTDAEIMAKLKVVKIDANTKEVIKRSNIKFKIFSIDKNEYVCQTITYPEQKTICEFETDKNGEFITPNLLNAGKYRLEEVDQIIDGFLWNKYSQEFTIDENANLINDGTYGVIFSTVFENNQVKGEVSVKKYGEKLVIEDGKFYYEEIQLDNVEYELYANEDIISGDGTLIYKKDELIGTYITENGGFTVSNMFLGKYFFLEKKTDDKHILDTEKHEFELKYKDQYTPIVNLNLTFKNYLGKSEFKFTKIDLVTGEPLPNTKIQIFTNNDGEERQLVFEGYTNEFGEIVIKDLFVSKFVLFECEAPEGYILNPEPMEFEITKNGEIIKANMTNERIIEVPITEKDDMKEILISGFILTVVGTGIIIYGKIKKRK